MKKYIVTAIALVEIITFSGCGYSSREPKSSVNDIFPNSTNESFENPDSELTSKSNSKTSEEKNSGDSEPEQFDTPTYKLNTGELLDVKENDDVLIIKAKIKLQSSDKLTINQNYHNVQSIIKSGGDKFKEIQYWAVADSTSGEEIKVISFTVPENIIEETTNGKIVATQYPDLVTDLWILPSLLSTTSSTSTPVSTEIQQPSSTAQTASESPKSSSVSKPSSSSTPFTEYSKPQATTTYVLNTNTKKFHYSSCSDVNKIKPENYSTISSRADAISRGYSPCGRCKP